MSTAPASLRLTVAICPAAYPPLPLKPALTVPTKTPLPPARVSDTPLMLGNITRQILQTAIDEMGPDADLNTLIRLYEKAAKVTVSKG